MQFTVLYRKVLPVFMALSISVVSLSALACSPPAKQADLDSAKVASQLKPTGMIPAQEVPVSEPQAQQADDHLAETLTVDFHQRFQAVLNDAKSHILKQPADKRKRDAVVLDIDETILDNRAYYAQYKVYEEQPFESWMMQSKAPAIYETLRFVEWLQERGIKVYFVTGRYERLRDATVENLVRVGVSDFAGLYMKPNDYNKDSASYYKIGAREQIESDGNRILAVIGDQRSDIDGGHGQGFKVPNPLYFIP